MVSGLQFSFVPLGATIANFSDTNSPTLARENKTFGQEAKQRDYSHFVDEETEIHRG